VLCRLHHSHDTGQVGSGSPGHTYTRVASPPSLGGILQPVSQHVPIQLPSWQPQDRSSLLSISADFTGSYGASALSVNIGFETSWGRFLPGSASASHSQVTRSNRRKYGLSQRFARLRTARGTVIHVRNRPAAARRLILPLPRRPCAERRSAAVHSAARCRSG
jgi:hypothetical protein